MIPNGDGYNDIFEVLKTSTSFLIIRLKYTTDGEFYVFDTRGYSKTNYFNGSQMEGLTQMIKCYQ
jgi:hypothetical protein